MSMQLLNPLILFNTVLAEISEFVMNGRATPIGFNLLLQTALLLAFGLLSLSIARRRRPQLQSFICRASLVGVALSMLLTFKSTGSLQPALNVPVPTVSHWIHVPSTPPVTSPLPAFPPRTDTNVGNTNVTAKAPVAASEDLTSANETAHRSTPAPATRAMRVDIIGAAYRAFLVLWIVVALNSLAWLVLCHVYIMRLRQTATKLDKGSAFDILRQLCAEHRGLQPILLAHPHVSSPLLCGLWKPAILLPATYNRDYDEAATRAVLLHELAHWQRCDLRWNLFSRILYALLWPQPLMWALHRRMEDVSEVACDQAVIDGGYSPQEYATVLMTLAERLSLGRVERVVGAGVVPFRSALGRRVQLILSTSRRGAARIPVIVRLALGLATLCMVASLPALIAVGKRTSVNNTANVATDIPFEQQKPDVVVSLLPPEAALPEPVGSEALQPQPIFPQHSETIDGVTVRITKAAWVKPEQKPGVITGNDPFEKYLRIWYEVDTENSQIKEAASGTLLSHVLSISTIDEWGNRSRRDSSNSDGSIYLGAIDPRATTVQLEFEFLDPRAPAGSTGEFQQTLSFQNVPMPMRRGPALAVNRSLITQRGTRVTIERVKLRDATLGKSVEHDLLFTVHGTPPKHVPDLQINPHHSDPTDPSGRSLMPPRHWAKGFASVDSIAGLPGRETLSSLVRADITTNRFNVRLTVTEKAPSLRQEKWFRYFRFNLNMNTIPRGEITPPLRPLAIVDAGDVKVSLQSLSNTMGEYHARLWMNDQSGNRSTPWHWQVQEALLRDNATNAPLDKGDASPFGSPVLWDTDGTPARELEGGQRVRIVTPEAQAAQKKLALQVKLQANRTEAAALDFRNLPIPPQGEMVAVNQTQRLPFGVGIMIKKIGYFFEKPREARAKTPLPPVMQFGIDYECTPIIEDGEKPLISYIARDERGREMKILNGTSASGNRFYLPFPAPGAKLINLRVILTETIKGPQKIILFKDLPVPQPKYKGKAKK